MLKFVIASLLSVACFQVSANTLTTKDGRMSLTVDSQKMMVRTPEADDVLPCKFIKSAPGQNTRSADKWNGYFYQCANDLTISIKNYTQSSRSDEIFIFEGNKVMYTEQLSSKFK